MVWPYVGRVLARRQAFVEALLELAEDVVVGGGGRVEDMREKHLITLLLFCYVEILELFCEN